MWRNTKSAASEDVPLPRRELHAVWLRMSKMERTFYSNMLVEAQNKQRSAREKERQAMEIEEVAVALEGAAAANERRQVRAPPGQFPG